MTVTCAGCGTTAADAPLTWMSATDERGLQWWCDRCTREHLRSVEGRLDPSWW